MTPARRNGLAILIVLVLGAGVVAAFTVDGDDGSETATQGQPTTVPTSTTTVATTAPQGTTTTVASTTTTTTSTISTTATTTVPPASHPNTGGPATLLAGLTLAAAGVLGLRKGRRTD